MMPIPPVARQARRLDAVDRADIAGAHHRDKPLEAGTLHRARSRATEIVVDHRHRCKAGRFCRLREIILPPLAFEVAGDLRHRRLTNVHDRGAAEWSGVILGFIDASQLRLGSQRLQQKIGQGLDQSLCVSLHGCCRNLTIQLENELRSTVVPVSPHGPSPSFLKDGIVRLASDSHRTTRERWQAR